MTTVYTIGHSNLSADEFFGLLEPHRVDLLVDVRSIPSSRRFPQLNRRPLAAEAARRGIEYRWLGDVLGGRPPDPALLTEGVPDYDKMAAAPALLDALAALAEAATTRTVVLMCAEADPYDCHRSRLLGRVLTGRLSVDVRHITRGALRSQPDTLP